MLYPPEATRQRVGKLLRNALKGDDPRAAAREILRLDPHCAPAHMLLGSTAFEAGRSEEAERHFWDGLAEWPCSHAFYMGLADARLVQEAGDSDDQLTKDMRRLAYRKIWMSGSIPEDLAQEFNNTIGGKAGLDFNKPESFLALAEAIDSDRSGPADPRLLPYLLLDMLQDQADTEEVDEDLIGQIRRLAEEIAPVFESALREWANDSEVVTPDAICLIIALLGEIAPVSALDNLLDAASTANDDDLFLHCHWAVWRMAQRFPDAAMEQFRARIPEAPVSLRCGIAEQFSLMPKGQVSSLTLLLLLKDFARIGGQMDADYLLSAAVHALETHGCLDDAKAAIRRCRPALPKTRQRDFDLTQARGFIPRLTAELITAFDIEAVCLERELFDDLDEDFDDEHDNPEDDDVIEMPVAAAPVSDPIYGRMFNKVMEAGQTWDPKLVVGRQAFGKFYGPSPGSNVEDRGFGKWYICDFRARRGVETLVERYLRERIDKLTAREKALLESWRDGLFSVWEVAGVDPGKGVELQDLCSPARMFVSDVTSSRSSVKGDCLLCRVEQFEGKWELGGDGMRVPRNILDALLGEVKREAASEGISESVWVRANSHQMHRKLMAALRAGGRAMPELRNYEGDSLEFSTATYEILEETATLAALRACSEFEETGATDGETKPIEFAWVGESVGENGRRSYGRIEIGGGHLRLECNSRQRLDKGRKLIGKLAGPHVKHLADSYETAAAAMKRVQPSGLAPVDPEISSAVIAQYMEQHYAQWPDERLPALGGKSPREAMGTSAGRRSVAELVTDMERRDKGAGHGGTYDFSKLRAALGVKADE